MCVKLQLEGQQGTHGHSPRREIWRFAALTFDSEKFIQSGYVRSTAASPGTVRKLTRNTAFVPIET